ncbi:MAG: PP2C family protein-serine/threonine phosphatase [Chloracidobacterium sp.]|nr:PP2C family protein-serine/threonine phosphatase [Chloracidobacterium sp.]MDW8216394.1 PP2C family protein-serine/threonine phosphatase [Acidobacteriota bacterium]
MPAWTSRLPFPPTVVVAVIALFGLVSGLVLTSQNLPDLTLLDELDRPTNTRLAHDFLLRQTGQPPPDGFTFRLLQLDRPSLTVLRQSRPEADTRRLAHQAHLPLVIDHVVWFRSNGKLAARIGLTSTGELVSYLNGETPPTTNEPPQETAIARARAFLNGAGVGLAWLGAPQVESVPGQTETEVRWQQPVAELPELTRVIVVRLRGETVWYFQHRLQPTAVNQLRQLDLSIVPPLLTLSLQIGLLAVAIAYLLKTARRHAILWRVPTVSAAVVGCSLLLAFAASLPYTVNKSMFESPVGDSSPLRLASLQTQQGIVISVGSQLVSGLIYILLEMGTVWAACAALLHIEYEIQRPCAEVFRSVLLLRRVPYATMLERNLVGSGVGWALLGFTGAFCWLTNGSRRPIEQASDQLMLLLDAWSPELLVFGTLIAGTFTQGIVFIAFVWLALADWLRWPLRVAWLATALVGGIGWNDPFIFVTSYNLTTPWFWVRDVVLALALTATFESFGLWATLCAIWVYQATGMAVIAATLPATGFSPWLPALSVMLPFTTVALTWRPAESERDTQPTLLERVIEEQRQAQQLALAARIQAAFLPTNAPQLEGWDIAAATLPAREVGGDFYDFFHGPNKTLGIFMGDVSGKSVSGALFTAVAMTTFRSEVEEDKLGCAAMLTRLNELLYPDMKRVRMFVAAAYVQLDLTSGRFTVANAGLPAPAYRRRGALSGESAVTFLEVGGLPLGSFRRTTYNELQAVLHLESQDCLVLTSDGVVEALNEERAAYGYERLAAVVDRHADQGAQSLCEAIVADVKRHIGDGEQSDDITIVVIQRRSSPPPSASDNGFAQTTSRNASSSAEKRNT